MFPPGSVQRKISRADIWLDPLCCREAQAWLETQPSCATAWERCFHPFFVCWFLDYVRGQVPGFASIEKESLGLFTRTPWRVLVYRDFFAYEMGFPAWAVSLVLWGVRKSRRFSLWVFWFVDGYFETRRGKNDMAHWWIYTATDIKALYQAARGFLSESE
jgi:hypothetical protein